MKLTFNPHQVAFWDEIHIDVVIGTILQDYLTFACDEVGTYKVDRVRVRYAFQSAIEKKLFIQLLEKFKPTHQICAKK